MTTEPTNKVPKSYDGPVEVRTCDNCGHKARIGTFGKDGPKTGFCRGCKQIVEWKQ